MRNLNKKGAINFMIELFIGAILMMIIIAASYYFAEQSNIEATAIVYAQNSKTNCMVNMNTLMQSDSFLDERKTSTVLSRSYEKPTAETKGIQPPLNDALEAIAGKLSAMLPDTAFSLRIYDYCSDITKGCKASSEQTLASADSEKSYNDESRYESCVYPIPVACDPEAYTNLEATPNEVEACTIFAEMRLNY